MATFKDQLASDAANVFLNSNEFAEEITYIPSIGTSRIIKAIVDRKRVTPAGEDTGRIVLDQTEITIANDPVYGLDAIQKGVDKFSFPEVIDGSNITWAVQDILGQDAGMWRLLVQK